MNRLPQVKLEQASLKDKETLAQWLQERDVERTLASEDEQQFPPAGGEHSRLTDAVEAGQIRLFTPFCAETAARLCYVAVIGKKNHQWLVVPFSRYGTPATPGEWQTRRDATHLRVLCAWNAFEISDSALAKSWLVDNLEEEEQNAVKHLLSSSADGSPPPSDLNARTGPPLRHPLDPRHDYIEEEKMRILSIKGNTLIYPTRKPPERLPLAAEERDEYRTDDDPGDLTSGD